MARIVIQALHSDGELRRWTLSERIVAENLDSDHYVTQLVERLSWATADAEALESPSLDLSSPNADDGRERERAAVQAGAKQNWRPDTDVEHVKAERQGLFSLQAE